jgi:hypothetical protein
VPIADSAMLAAKLVKGAVLKGYKGAPHGMCTTHKDRVNEDLLAFIKGSSSRMPFPGAPAHQHQGMMDAPRATVHPGAVGHALPRLKNGRTLP